MDYEKKYKEIVGLIKKAYLYAQTDSTKAVLEEIFPELSESEDEKVRKELIDAIQGLWDNDALPMPLSVKRKDEWLAWLEKQKNCEYIRKDWLEHIKQSWYKEGFIDGKYTHKELTINDVTTLNELIDFLENGTAKLQHDLTLYANWLKTQFPTNEKQGEQKDFAPKKVEPRYEIGDVLCDKSCTTLDKNTQPNLEVTDIRNGMYICDKGCFPISQQDEYELVAKRIEQKPAWSEEDETG